jgi:hypothetical protein
MLNESGQTARVVDASTPLAHTLLGLSAALDNGPQDVGGFCSVVTEIQQRHRGRA